jgi:hypothetical protein
MFKALWGFIFSERDERFWIKVYPNLNMETQYKLITFRTPADFPITGTIKLKNQLKWIKMRTAIGEEMEKDPIGSSIGIQYPGINDVLF